MRLVESQEMFYPVVVVINALCGEEGNMIYGGGSRLMQMSHGRGIFGDNTTEILHWMRDTKKVKRVERVKCMYGKILQH